MDGRVEMELPWPPSVNAYYRHVRGMTLISRSGRAYRDRVNAIAKANSLPRFRGRVRLTVDAYPPDNLRRDLDNILKCLLDSLTKAGAWEDDSQVRVMHLRMNEALPPNGLVYVKYEEIQ